MPRGLLLLIGALALVPLRARAALGEPRASVEADRRALGGDARSAADRGRYAVETFELHGTVVREYVRSDGRVFAVAWEGLIHPDLDLLLGASAAAWRAARDAAPRPGSRSFRRLAAGEAIVETWGHMRHLGGRALLPSLVPPGVGDDELR